MGKDFSTESAKIFLRQEVLPVQKILERRKERLLFSRSSNHLRLSSDDHAQTSSNKKQKAALENLSKECASYVQKEKK